MLTDQETHDLQLRVLDLKVRIEAIEAQLEAQGDLLDSMIVFLKEAHDEKLPTFERVERAAEEALRP